jgi:TonB-dependent SusC/RagA subfamily outer membrane receptor
MQVKINKMKVKIFFLILVSVVCISTLSAQKSNKKITITGTVLDASNNPIVNAIVMIDNKKTDAVTDSKGNYKVKVKPDASTIAILTFGSGISEELINGRTMINFNFGTKTSEKAEDEGIKKGEEGVNVGYGNIKQKNLTTNVNKIDGTKKKYATYNSIADMIQREVSGVKIDGSSVIIQDSKDLFGSVPALIVVDGVSMNSLPNIHPSSVESIEVLKGTAAAIYGTRGYGGVIVIKTKVQISK